MRSPPVTAVTSSKQGPALPTPSTQPRMRADLLEEATWPSCAGCPGTLPVKAVTRSALGGLLATGEVRLETGDLWHWLLRGGATRWD